MAMTQSLNQRGIQKDQDLMSLSSKERSKKLNKELEGFSMPFLQISSASICRSHYLLCLAYQSCPTQDWSY